MQHHLWSKWEKSRIRLQKWKYCAFPLLLILSRLDARVKAHYSLWRKNNSLLIIGTSRLYLGHFRSSIYIVLVTKRINKKRLFSKSGQEWTKFLLQGQWKIVLHHLLYRVLVLHTNTYLCMYLSLFSKYK